MVVVDTGPPIPPSPSRAAGARVEQINWPGDFALARNQALEFLKGDWVLVLDADEQLRPEVIPSLSADGPARCAGDQPAALRAGCRHGSSTSVSRLFRRHPAIRWSRPYHSMIDDSVRELLDEEPQGASLTAANQQPA